MDSIDPNREIDRVTKVYATERPAKNKYFTLEQIKSAYITDGLSLEQLSSRFNISPERAFQIVDEGDLDNLRRDYIKEGIAALQKTQASHAKRLLDMESQFKQLRIEQLESQLQDYLAYYARNGSLRKFHPITGEVLVDSDGIPLQLRIPNLIKEIEEIKSSVQMTDSLKDLLVRLDDVIHGESKGNEDYVDLTSVDGIFRPAS